MVPYKMCRSKTFEADPYILAVLLLSREAGDKKLHINSNAVSRRLSAMEALLMRKAQDVLSKCYLFRPTRGRCRYLHVVQPYCDTAPGYISAIGRYCAPEAERIDFRSRFTNPRIR